MAVDRYLLYRHRSRGSEFFGRGSFHFEGGAYQSPSPLPRVKALAAPSLRFSVAPAFGVFESPALMAAKCWQGICRHRPDGLSVLAAAIAPLRVAALPPLIKPAAVACATAAWRCSKSWLQLARPITHWHPKSRECRHGCRSTFDLSARPFQALGKAFG